MAIWAGIRWKRGAQQLKRELLKIGTAFSISRAAVSLPFKQWKTLYSRIASRELGQDFLNAAIELFVRYVR